MADPAPRPKHCAGERLRRAARNRTETYIHDAAHSSSAPRCAHGNLDTLRAGMLQALRIVGCMVRPRQ
uniref:Uncharacterized protein n=1 Tax=Lysobacter sp. ATCC 53042 TaxID=324869 RepID=F8TUH9_9GAMM|nr:unknown [Lysobacter sp. ATCC 53042]